MDSEEFWKSKKVEKFIKKIIKKPSHFSEEFGISHTKIIVNSKKTKIPRRITRSNKRIFLAPIKDFCRFITVIIMGKLFGLLSLSRQNKNSEWVFKMRSFQFLYAIIIIATIVSSISIAIYSQVRDESVHTKIGNEQQQ
jgi:hypothetical protein